MRRYSTQCHAVVSPATLFSFFPFFISLYLKCFLFFLFHHFYPVASNLFSLYCQAKDSGSSNSFHSQPLKQSLVQPQSQSQTHTHNSVLTSSNSNAPQGFSSNAPHGFSSNAPQGFSSKDLQDPHTLGDRDRDRDRDRGRRGEETSELDEKVSTLKYQVRRVETWHYVWSNEWKAFFIISFVSDSHHQPPIPIPMPSFADSYLLHIDSNTMDTLTHIFTTHHIT